MTPQFRTISLYQGQTLRTQFLIVDGDQNPINLSARTARMQVREYLESTLVLFELTTENGGLILGADGLLTLNMSSVDTAALSPGRPYEQQWVYDLEIITPGAPPIVDRILTGAVVFSPEITRA